MEWISVKDRLPEDEFKKYLVRKENEYQIPAFFMPDKMAWITWYGMKGSYWMCVVSGELIYNVTHWTLLTKLPTSEESQSSSLKE